MYPRIIQFLSAASRTIVCSTLVERFIERLLATLRRTARARSGDARQADPGDHRPPP
jgi:hypothetical protein